MNNVVRILESSDSGLSLNNILTHINMKYGRLEKCLKFLQIEGVLYKEKSKYYRSVNPWIPDFSHSDKIT